MANISSSDYDAPSNLTSISEQFRICSVAINSGKGHYQCGSGKEYDISHPDTKNADGDELGRDPSDGEFNEAGNCIDMGKRNGLLAMAKNYYGGQPYGQGNC